MTRRTLLTHLALAAGGLPCAVVAWKAGAPIPFLLGPLAFAALATVVFRGSLPDGYIFLPRIRIGVMAIIGVAIGAQITPGLLGQLPAYIPSLLAMTAFVPLVHFLNYQILRRTGGLSRVDAVFSGSPGGFVEAVATAEHYGGSVRMVTIQHFLRIVLVIGLIPLALSLYLGFPVGRVSAQADMFAPLDWEQLGLAGLYAVIGFVIAKPLRLPAGHLIGPLLISGAMGGFGLAPPVTVPPIVIAGAQIVVGLSLGSRFAGVTLSELRRAGQSSVLCVVMMLVIGFSIAEGLQFVTGASLEILFLTFAPGGVTEMGLIALSLSGNPAVVVMHHVYRIIITVVFLNTFLRRTRFLERD